MHPYFRRKCWIFRFAESFSSFLIHKKLISSKKLYNNTFKKQMKDYNQLSQDVDRIIKDYDICVIELIVTF